jgi:hypothetical protein
MEAEIERLYQIVEDLQKRVKSLEDLELEQRIENIRQLLAGGYEL